MKNELQCIHLKLKSTQIYKALGKDEDLSVSHIIKRIEKKFPGEDIDDIVGVK